MAQNPLKTASGVSSLIRIFTLIGVDVRWSQTIGGGQYQTVVWNISQNECKEAAEMTETLGVLWSCFSLVPVFSPQVQRCKEAARKMLHYMPL